MFFYTEQRHRKRQRGEEKERAHRAALEDPPGSVAASAENLPPDGGDDEEQLERRGGAPSPPGGPAAGVKRPRVSPRAPAPSKPPLRTVILGGRARGPLVRPPPLRGVVPPPAPSVEVTLLEPGGRLGNLCRTCPDFGAAAEMGRGGWVRRGVESAGGGNLKI